MCAQIQAMQGQNDAARTANVPTPRDGCGADSVGLRRRRMARPKGPDLTREKHYRCTEEEARLEEAIVQRYAEQIGGSSQSGTAWFRAMLKREAKRLGIRLADVAAPGAGEEATAAGKPRRRKHQ